MRLLKLILFLFIPAFVASMMSCGGEPVEENITPNVVVIFLDDSGWADFHPFGNPAYPGCDHNQAV